MKAISTILSFIVIVSVLAASLFFYLDEHYNFSALLTLSWIISVVMWVNSSGLLDKKVHELKR
jgi:hypothetical protein